jgi:ABC-2 type transport system ATP-binding protein
MDEAEHCQDLAFIHRGKIIAHGAPEEIKIDKMEGQVLEIDCDQPDVAIGALRTMSQFFEEVALYGAQIHVVADEIEKHKADIAQTLKEAGVRVRSMDLIPPSLEDVFIANVRNNE